MKTTLHLEKNVALSVLMLFVFFGSLQAQLAYKDGRISFNAESALILPIQPVLCLNSEGVELTANVVDINNEYTYIWSGPSCDGLIGKTIIATRPGEYTVSIWAGETYPFAILSTTVKQSEMISSAKPGQDMLLCYNGDLRVNLDAEVSGPANWLWQGGDGVFVNGRLSMQGTYIPSENEIEQGYVDLTLVPALASGCEQTSKPMHIAIADFSATASVVIRHASNETSKDASIEFSFSGGATPFSYQWSHGATTPYVSGLGTGVYQVKITDANGCEAWSSVTITHND
jgi:hypothetical protein